jgi:polar amino acid transport system permease protein
MRVDTVRQPGATTADPHLSMGLELLAAQNRARLTQSAKVGAVWVALVALMAATLLQLRIDLPYIARHFDYVVQGVLTTLWISLVSISIATVLALFGALGRLSGNSVAQGVSGLYVSVIRGTPLLVQIWLIHLGLPQIGIELIGLGFPRLGGLFILRAIQSGILALSLNYGAYMTEVFRAGIQSIGHGQWEAARSLGMTYWQMLRRVILPQALHVIIPDIGNNFIFMLKDSALVSVIGVLDITCRASRLARRDSKPMEMLLVAAAVYWILTIVSSWLQSRLENRMARAYRH